MVASGDPGAARAARSLLAHGARGFHARRLRELLDRL
jgi:hypothetical protein